ncbi:MAG: hypothetical protein LBU92_04160 [Prevotellaceae bacterium]|jgi:hypothetical protein|nr:hypothetical protein [Prevotellaceae bacterium]
MLQPNIFLYNFSNLFVLLVGLNFAYVFLVRPRDIEKRSGSSHFFFDVIDKIAWNAIDKITSKKKKAIGEAEKRCTKMEYFISSGKLSVAARDSFFADKLKLENEYIKGDKVDSLEKEYKDKIERKTAVSHLPFICGLTGLYGILVLIFAAVNETQPTSFLFWSNALIIAVLVVCLVAEGELWFRKEKHPILHNLCGFLNYCFHPHFWKVLIIFPIMFVYFVTSLNGRGFNAPNWMTDRSIVYITIGVCLLGFVGYFVWSTLFIACVTIRYRNATFFRKLGRAIKSVDDTIHNHKEELDRIDEMLKDEKINKSDFGL